MKDELLRLGRLQAEKAAAAAKTTAESVIVPATHRWTPAAEGSNKHSDSGIIVEGLGNCLVKFAKCCTPVPGDPVVGFITRGYGVSVHRQDCPNADPGKRKPEEAARWVKVSWVEGSLPNYKTALELSSKDRDGLTLDVAMALSAAKVKVTALSARSMPDGYASVSVVVGVRARGPSPLKQKNNNPGALHCAGRGEKDIDGRGGGVVFGVLFAWTWPIWAFVFVFCLAAAIYRAVQEAGDGKTRRGSGWYALERRWPWRSSWAGWSPDRLGSVTIIKKRSR